MADDQKTLRTLEQENIRLRSENTSLRDILSRLQQALAALTSLQNRLDHITVETNIYSLIHNILESALNAIDSGDGSLILLDEESEDLVFVEVIGKARNKLLHYRLRGGEGIAGWVVDTCQPRLVEDVRKETHFSPLVDKMTGLRTETLICVPIIDGERSIGAIEVINTHSGRPFNETDKDVMLLVGRLAAMAIVLAERNQP